MHNPSISILGPGPDVMLIEGFDCSQVVFSFFFCILIIFIIYMLM